MQRQRFLGFLPLLLAWSGLAEAQIQFQLPANYLSRFSAVTVATGGSDEGFGVRGVPLPFKETVRFNLVRHTHYWEYVLSARVKDTTFLLGRVDDGEASRTGVLRAEVNHDPFAGWQWGALWQEGDNLSKVSAGYAWAAEQNRVRLAVQGGYGRQGEVEAPYAVLDARLSDNATLPNKLGRANLTVSTRSLLAPTLGEVQSSLDVSGSLTLTPKGGFSVTGRHLERFVLGEAVFADLDLDRYNVTSLSAVYRLPATPQGPGVVGAVGGLVQREWVDEYTTVRGDLLFNVPGVPFMIGPRVGYRWGPTQAQNSWVFSIATLGK
ncbi:hypothetical protein V3W47_06300 [Deinococcus sp. YIM 134068]|uniref:hypothetical protein n=1 Tax=Deinococcus lichenicola TaxID=3118910 RepID=UPI002F95CFD7